MMKHLQFAFSLCLVIVAAFGAIYLAEGYLEGRAISEAAISGAAPVPQPQNHLLSKLTNPWNSQRLRGMEQPQTMPEAVPVVPAQVHHGLCVAAMTGNKDQTQSLLDTGVSANARDSFGIRAVARATLWGHRDVVRLLLERGAHVNERERLGVTLLMLAANQGDEKLLSMFLEYGADVNARSEDGETALLAARKKGFTRIAELLIHAGAEEPSVAGASSQETPPIKVPEKSEQAGEPAHLIPPVQEPSVTLKPSSALKAAPSEFPEQAPLTVSTDISSPESQELIPFQEASEASSAADALVWAAGISQESIRVIEEEMVREIQSREARSSRAAVPKKVGAPVLPETQAFVSEKTLLPSAEERHKDLDELAAMIEEIKALSFVSAREREISASARPTEPVQKKEEPAVPQPEKTEAIKPTISVASPVVKKDPPVPEKPLPVIPARVQQRPPAPPVPSAEKTALRSSRELPKARPVLITPSAVLPAARPKVPPMELFHAVVTGNSQKVKFCLDRGVNVNVRGALGMTPLMVASQEGNLGIVEMLLQKQADVGARNVVGQTALRLAALKERHDIMVMLQRHGARE